MRTALVVAAVLALPSAALADPATNGKFVNTDTLNGKFVNGKFVNGKFVNTAVLDNGAIGGSSAWTAWKPGHYLYYPYVEGTGLAGWAWDWAVGGWTWRTGEWFVGTEMAAKMVDETSGAEEMVALRISRIERAEPNGDMLLHWVHVQSVDDQQNVTWFPYCGYDGNGAEVPAIMLRGEWSLAQGFTYGGDQISDSPYRVTFACATGALGKCAATCTDAATCAARGIPFALGYARWRAPHWVFTGASFEYRDYVLDHQACTRMIRADYCGDGLSWTQNGTPIDVYDRSRINVQTVATPQYWQYEATWNADGAVRINCSRFAEPVQCPRPADVPITSPWISPVNYICYDNDGLVDPAARLGNLFRVPLEAPLPITPIRF